MTFTRFNALERIRHINTGNIYKVFGRCTYEPTNTECMSYMGEDGHVWVSPIYEMEDGRFVLTDETSRD